MRALIVLLALLCATANAYEVIEDRKPEKCVVNPVGKDPNQPTEVFKGDRLGAEARAGELADLYQNKVNLTCTEYDQYLPTEEPPPPPPPEPMQCEDGVDNDGDGFIDMDDPGCDSPADNDEFNEPPPPPPPPSASCGSPYRGIPDPCAHMGYDVYADYEVDEVVTGNVGVINGQGTATDPYFVDASGLNRNGRLVISGSYVVVVGGFIDYPQTDGPALDVYPCEYCTVRDMEVFGDSGNFDAGNDAAMLPDNNQVLIRLKLHGFGDRRTGAREQDYHGIKTQERDVWILDSEIYDVSGDSIQCGDASRGDCQRVYIGGGWMRDNRENGIDIKDSRDVVVSGVQMSGFSPTSSSPGEALIVHDDAYDAKIYDNNIFNATLGIVSSGRSGHEITNNTIQASDTGIELRNTSNLTVTGNQISAPTCVDNQSGTSGTIQTGCD